MDLGKFGSFFYTPDESKKTAPGAVAAPVAAAPKPVVPVVPGQVDEEMTKILTEAIEASNLPGFDYLEFRDSLVRMSGAPMTEDLKFQAVYATAQSMVTKQGLLDAIDHYLKVVEAKAVEFEQVVAGVERTEVTAKEQLVSDLETAIQKDVEEIKRLTTSIQERREKQNATNLEIVKAKQDIQGKRSAFEATRAAVANNLTSDRTKIETFLK